MGEPRKMGGASIGKKKSLNDIYEQRNRIVAGSQGNPQRIARAIGLAKKYTENIKKTKEYAFDVQRYEKRFAEAMEAARAKGYVTAAQANKDKKLTKKYGTYSNDFFNERLAMVYPVGMYEREYSRRTYTGNNRK